MVFLSRLRPGAAMILMAGLLGLGMACHKGSGQPAGTVNVSGYVTYTRTPVVYDTSSNAATSGQPLSLGTPNSYASPARGVVVRAFCLATDIDSSGKLTQVWHLVGTTYTDLNGYYQILGGVVAGQPTFVEVDSIFQQSGGHQSAVKIIADPAGINSSLPEPQRPIYVYRLDANSTIVANPVVPDPTDLTSSVAVPVVNFTVNFNLGSTDNWYASRYDWYVPGTNPDYPGDSNQPQDPTDTTPVVLGSKVLGMVDDAYIVSEWYGDPTPSLSSGGVLDLHYRPGIAESYPSRSYVVYNRSLTPLADTGTVEANGTTEKFAYFGTLAGATALDDGWDQGVIFPMLCRNYLFGQGKSTLFPTGSSSLPSLAPDLAVIDGMGDAMAATLLTTPWLTDTTKTPALTPRDIRVIPAGAGLGSPGAMASLAWQISLKATNITAPGTYAQWSNNWTYGSPTGLSYPLVTARLFSLIYPTVQTLGTYGTVTERTDTLSIYSQGQNLQAAQDGAPVNLADIFSNLTLYTLMTPYNLSWPLTQAAYPYVAADWDSTTNPLQGPLLGTLPGFTLSMANAQLIPNPAPSTTAPTPAQVYPNCSQGEVAYAKLSLNLDSTYSLGLNASYASGVGTVQGLPPGATIEVLVDGALYPPALPNPQPQTFTFSAASPGPYNVSLAGNPTDFSNPIWHWIRFRMISPTVQQPDVTVTPTLTLISNQ